MARKRIRGLRRHSRNHRRRAATSTPLDLTLLTSHHYDYLKLGLSPWYQDDQPPLAIRRLWATRLLADFWRWHTQLAALGEPFHLAIWLFEPHFGESQLTASVGQMRERYINSFDPAPAAPLPQAYRHLPGFADLRWSVGLHEWILDDDEFAEWFRQRYRSTYYRFITPDGEPYVAARRGRVWVGQAPA